MVSVPGSHTQAVPCSVYPYAYLIRKQVKIYSVHYLTRTRSHSLMLAYTRSPNVTNVHFWYALSLLQEQKRFIDGAEVLDGWLFKRICEKGWKNDNLLFYNLYVKRIVALNRWCLKWYLFDMLWHCCFTNARFTFTSMRIEKWTKNEMKYMKEEASGEREHEIQLTVWGNSFSERK